MDFLYTILHAILYLWILLYSQSLSLSLSPLSFALCVCLVFVSFLFSLKFNLFCNYSSNTGWLMPLLFICDVVHLNGTISICDTHKNSFSGIIYPLLRMNPISAIRRCFFSLFLSQQKSFVFFSLNPLSWKLFIRIMITNTL